MKNKKTKIIIVLLAFIYLLIAEKLGIGIPCFFKKLTGLYCPGCGITRMFISILQLDFYQAFRYNPLVFIMFIGYIIYKIINYKNNIKINKYIIYSLLIITLIFGVIRNIPNFDFLQPTEIITKK